MAGEDERRSGRGGRVFGLAALAALVAAAILYFRDCVPGFGVGGSPSTPPSTPAAASTDAGGAKRDDTLHVSVDGEQCRRGTDPPASCPALCESLAAEPKTRKILVNGTLGTHAAVDALRRCLVDEGFRDVVVRTE